MVVIQKSRSARARVAAVVALTMLVAGLAQPTVVVGLTDEQLDEGMKGRASFGLKSDRPHVRQLFSEKLSHRSDEYGFPLTAAEATELAERDDWADRIGRQAMPKLRKRSDFAGEFIDQRDGGKLTVYLTSSGDAAKDAVRALIPKTNSRGVKFKTVKH